MKQRIMITLAGVIAVAIVAQQAVKRTFLKKETFMKLNRIAYFGAIFIPVLLLQANVRTEVPPDPGPPIYSFVQRLLDGSPYFIHDNQWAAVLFLRDPNCVPPTFNLLDLVDSTPAFPGGPPQPFLCALTASGFAIWNNGPPPIDFVPIQDHMQGLGQVPAWFVSRADMEAAVADDNLTVPELLAIPSLVKGYATQYLHDNQPGGMRPQGEGNGKLVVVASGRLENGQLFQIEWREMGVKSGGGVSYIRHARIDFR